MGGCGPSEQWEGVVIIEMGVCGHHRNEWVWSIRAVRGCGHHRDGWVWSIRAESCYDAGGGGQLAHHVCSQEADKENND